MNEVDFVNTLRRMVASGRMEFDQLDRELQDRYEAADDEQRRQLQDAITQHLHVAERIAQNLALFSSNRGEDAGRLEVFLNRKSGVQQSEPEIGQLSSESWKRTGGDNA